MNFYPEADESGMGKSAMMLYPTPGLVVDCQIAGAAQVRCIFTITGRTFTVIDTELYERLGVGNLHPIGSVGNDGNLVSITASPQQLLIASAGVLYVYQLQTQAEITLGKGVAGTFTTIPSATFPGPVSLVGFTDGFFIALIASAAQYWASQSFDATNWTANGAKIISTFADNVVSMIVDHREIFLLGAKASDPQYDSGNLFPFDSVPGGFMEEGCGATYATVQLDNTILWIGARNDQGGGMAWRASGYTPQRISTHAIETAWQAYPTIADARAFSYQDQGHKFWVINFPSGNATWVYDVATQLWHQRGYWNARTGSYNAALPQCHIYVNGMHLVGDRQSGTIYQMAIPSVSGGAWKFVTDNGNVIRRMRAAPHISTEQKWIFHNFLQIDLETGLGPQPVLVDGSGNPRGPKISLDWSDDGGHTWSNTYDMDCGRAGEYRKRVIQWGLGSSRDRVYRIVAADPVPYRIIDCYLNDSSDFKPQERLSKTAAKVS